MMDGTTSTTSTSDKVYGIGAFWLVVVFSVDDSLLQVGQLS